MLPSTLLLVAAIASLCFCLYKFIVYPIAVSSLSKVPNAHWSVPFSSVWVLWQRHQFQENRALYKAHKNYGTVVRLAPDELSVNCVDNGLRTIYAGGFEKHEWYPNLFANYDGVPNMFSTAGSTQHSGRKRVLSNIYSKSVLQGSAAFTSISHKLLHERFVPMLFRLIERSGDGTIEMQHVLNTITMDFVTSYIFGYCNASNFVENENEARWWLDRYQSRKAFVFWPQEMPRLTDFVAKCFNIKLSPGWVGQANKELEHWCLQLCDKAEQWYNSYVSIGKDNNEAENYPTVYLQLRNALVQKNASVLDAPVNQGSRSNASLSRASARLQIGSELLDELSAGHETSGITLAFLFYELALDANLQREVYKELNSLKVPFRHTKAGSGAGARPMKEFTTPQLKELDALPILHSVLMETLRLHAAIPGPQPRITPQTPAGVGVTLGPYSHIPPNVRVSSNAHCLHRNEEIFNLPETFDAYRWVPDPPKITKSSSDGSIEMTESRKARIALQYRWFWAFGSGGRMCIGSNLAIAQMKLIVASIVSLWKIELPSDDLDERRSIIRDMQQGDAYTIGPMGKTLHLKPRLWQPDDFES